MIGLHLALLVSYVIMHYVVIFTSPPGTVAFTLTGSYSEVAYASLIIINHVPCDFTNKADTAMRLY